MKARAFCFLIAAIGAGIGGMGCASDLASRGDVGETLPTCGPREASQTDGTCSGVGPEEPPATSSRSFARSVDGWGITAIHGLRCRGTDMALLGESECVPVDDCSHPFPPVDAEVIVSTKSTDPRAVATLEAALAKVSRGGIIAVDSGKYDSSSPKSDVTIVGRCARDTILGNGKNNAIYVNGANVVLRSLTLSSQASPIAVSRGTVDAERVIIKDARVGVGLQGLSSKVKLRHSLIEGLGRGEESMGGLPARGSTLILEDSEIREVESGILVSDPQSRAELKRVVVNVLDGSARSTGLNASAGGHVQAEESVVRSTSTRLVAVFDDVGTDESATARPSAGTMVIRSSVLEQAGAELKDVPAIDVKSAGATLELTDVTLRHQTPVGVLVSKGAVRMTRVAILGDAANAEMRAGAMLVSGGVLDAEALAVPWAQGLAILVGEGAQLDLRKSLLANVVERAEAGEAVLVVTGSASIADCELANNERTGIVAIGESTFTVKRSFIHGTHAPDGIDNFGVVALHSTGTLDGCVLERNGEGIAAAGSSVLVQSSAFRAHRIALHAGDGMAVVDDKNELTPNAIAVTACTFSDNAARTSTGELPRLNAPPNRLAK